MISILFNTYVDALKCAMCFTLVVNHRNKMELLMILIYIVLTIYNIWWGLVMNRFF